MNLYIVATPIGNLEDITLRALRTLKEVDFILSEDTRVTQKLLNHYKIQKKLISFHHHSGEDKYERILSLLKSGKSLAVVSDAGTPNISDPGGKLVEVVRRELPDVNIEPIPGASALATALSVAGINTDKFCFMGFLPHKKGRQKAIKEIIDSKNLVIFYESKHRILRLIKELQELDFNKKIMIFREMTKMHYTFYNQDIASLYKLFEQEKNSTKGEFTIIIY